MNVIFNEWEKNCNLSKEKISNTLHLHQARKNKEKGNAYSTMDINNKFKAKHNG